MAAAAGREADHLEPSEKEKKRKEKKRKEEDVFASRRSCFSHVARLMPK